MPIPTVDILIHTYIHIPRYTHTYIHTYSRCRCPYPGSSVLFDSLHGLQLGHIEPVRLVDVSRRVTAYIHTYIHTYIQSYIHLIGSSNEGKPNLNVMGMAPSSINFSATASATYNMYVCM